MSKTSVVVIALFAAVAGFVMWWRQQEHAAPSVTPPIASAPPPPAAPPPGPVAPGIQHPIPPAQPPRGGLPSLDDSDGYVKNALIELSGRKAVLSFLHLDHFIRGFVATVNNLATDSASAPLWPVNLTPGRFDAKLNEGGLTISSRNADRYAPFVHFAESVDTRHAVALYVRLYPLFQSAYEDLGYPGKYFNDRVVEVIDELLATPTVAGAIRVKRITVDGAASSSSELYVFEDPTLEARSAGQKILLRVGHENALALMAKLKDVRQQVLAATGAQPTGRR